MYIEKRWLLPAMLSLLLLGGIFVVVVLALRPAQTQTRTVQLTSSTPVNPASCAPATAPVAAPVANRDTQINTGGFGDIGMQFQNVAVNAPITNVHISNAGNNNSNNINVGQGNAITVDPTPAAAATQPSNATTSTPAPTSTPTTSPPTLTHTMTPNPPPPASSSTGSSTTAAGG